LSAAPAFAPDETVFAALMRLKAALRTQGVEEAEAEARALLLAATGLSRADFVLEPERRLGTGAAARLEDFAKRRAAREPASRILGARGFWTLELKVAPGVLDPRADTETVVALALRLLKDRRAEPLSILDLGSGSGAILCALLSELPAARGVGVDISPVACQATRANLARSGVGDRGAALCGSWAEAIFASFDLVVSNPPYIRSSDIAALAPEVALHDPRTALDGGRDGLLCYRRMIPDLPRLLRRGGVAVLEAGVGQAPEIAEVMRGVGLTVAGVEPDLGGRERAVAAVW